MKGYRNALLILATLILMLALSMVAQADPPAPGTASGIALSGTVASKISYQGRLTDAAGNPLNVPVNLVFQLWNDATGGSQVGGDIVKNNVPVSNGLFTVELDAPHDAFNGQALWLRIQVNGQWLLPRQELLPVPYALSLRPGAWIEGSSTDAIASVVNQGLGVALYAQGSGMGVEGVGMTGVRGEGDVGVRGAGLVGVQGESEIGTGVRGTSVNSYGVVGSTTAPMTATAAAGVLGESVNGYGVEGSSNFGIGVFGHSSGGFGAGVGGSGVTGVFGTGAMLGVSGYTESDDGTGVAGTATGINGKGVEGIADNYGGTGVSGHATFGAGVIGEGETGVKGTGSIGYGVEGEGFNGVYGRSTSPDGCGGCFVNLAGGIALYAYGNGGTAIRASLRVDNSKAGDGMAAYLTNNSGYANAHLQNSGNGEVLVLQSNGGQFLRAVTDNWTPKFRLQYDGIGRAANSWQGGGADFAEMLPAVEGLQPGDVLVIGPDGKLTRSSEPYQASVVGVYSTNPGFVGGQPVEGEVAGTIPLAIAGVVPVKASAENGPIRPSDLLVASSIPGHAMKAGPNPPQGTVIGKALERLDKGTGVIKMLAVLQ